MKRQKNDAADAEAIYEGLSRRLGGCRVLFSDGASFVAGYKRMYADKKLRPARL